MDISFQNSIFLWFLLLEPLVAILHVYSLRHTRQKAIRFANFEALEKIVETKNIIPNNYLILAMRMATLCLFTLAASGITLHYETTAAAYDYAIAFDSSNSMLADDIPPSRMEAATAAASTWLAAMPSGSQVSVIQFSSQATVLLALSRDLSAASRAVKNIVPDKSGGTAICEALKAAANQFPADDVDRAVILISDGQNNAGCLLDDGIAYAKKNRVTVYAIGVGTGAGGSIEGLRDVVFVPSDADLRQVAQETGGEYFKAENVSGLSAAFGTLSNPTQRRQSLLLSVPAMIFAFLLVFADWGLSVTRYRSIP